MIRGIDISHWQSDIDLEFVFPSVDFVICKATEGTGYVDPFCDVFVQKCISHGKLWGFYHFANMNDPYAEADFFIRNTSNYFGHGIPVLDWEGDQDVGWVNDFVTRIHDEMNVWPWIYGNPWRFDQGGVESNCMRWVAKYPNVLSPSFEEAESWEVPYADGLVGCWQFCSDGKLPGYGGNLDLNIFYGDEGAWHRYAGSVDYDEHKTSILENEFYKVTIESKI